MSRASAVRSSALTFSSPTRRSTWKSTSWSSPKSPPVRPLGPLDDLARVVSRMPMLLRPAHAGSCTPYPAACSRGAAWRRKSYAVVVPIRVVAGRASRSAPCSGVNNRLARPSPASSASSGRSGKPGTRRPAQSSSAGT